jgi:small ubiquitin-related modifier
MKKIENDSGAQLSKLMKAYCDEKEIAENTVRFIFDGQRVNPAATPADLGLENGDIIDCFMEQIGGAW